MYCSKKVTAITFTQNSAELMDSAFKSVKYQSYDNLEWLVVDNASTDDTSERVAQYQKQDSRVKLIPFFEKTKYTEIVNAAFKNATGDYIAFLKPEDVWVKDKIQKQIGFAMRYDAPLCHTSYAFIDKDCNVLPVGCSKIEPFVNLVNYGKSAEVCLSTAMLNLDDVKKYFPFKFKYNNSDIIMYFIQKGLTSQGMGDVLSLCRTQYGPPTPPTHEQRILKLSKKIRAKRKQVPSFVRYDAYKANNIAKIKLLSSAFIDNNVYLSMNELKNLKL